MHKSYNFLAVLIMGCIYVQLGLAQVLPLEVIEEDKTKVLTSARIQPKPIDPLVWQRQFDAPVSQRVNRDFTPTQFGNGVVDTKLSLGPVRLVSQIIGRAPGQDVYYSTWERPRITFWGVAPTFSLRRDRYTKEYGIKVGVRIRF